MGIFSRLFGGTDSKTAPSQSPILSGKTVAVADSSLTIRAVLQVGFKGLGVTLAEFDSVDDLFNALSAAEPDVVLVGASDIRSDDCGFAQRIKRECPDAVVILLRSVFDDLHPDVETQPGLDAVHRKPFEHRELVQEIELLLA
jgi:CheY-like chemotaxis protein